MKKREAFTLIELIAVLVILAILALIVTPLVLNIIKKARTATDKRSIDAYGRSIELAIADYLLDKGEFPTSIEQLTIEYTGDEVVCTHATLNEDSSVYLAECTVGGRTVSGYTYGKEETVTYDAYEVGDEITYNNVDYYVIKDSDASESSVTLLKSEPLTVTEVNQYGTGHINRYTNTSVGTAYDINGYGGMAYYSSETCGYPNGNDDSYVDTGCTTDYTQSEIKYVVDTWKTVQAPQATEARLITRDEIDNFGVEIRQINPMKQGYAFTESAPRWLYNINCSYWTMSKYNDSTSFVWLVTDSGFLFNDTSVPNRYTVRPVIVLSKSALN